MNTSIHTMKFPGALTHRGFWLYVWKINTPQGERIYVGRTGDESSVNASSPFKRMGEHLDKKEKSNRLLRHLERHDIIPECCKEFEMIACGPLFPEVESRGKEYEKEDWDKHVKPRDKIAALEKKLADALKSSGYSVLNEVNCRRPLDEGLWNQVRKAFDPHFPNLSRAVNQAGL